MKTHIPATALALTLALMLTAPAFAAEVEVEVEVDDHFIVLESGKTRPDLARSIREYAQTEEDWIFLAEFDLAGGDITALKICYLPIGPDILDAGLHVGAMLPCGHIALYEQEGRTHMSILHPKFMTTLQPHPSLQRAVEKAKPAFESLLEHVLGEPVKNGL